MKIHGMARKGVKRSREYRTWDDMKQKPYERWSTPSQQAFNRRIRTHCKNGGHEFNSENTRIDCLGHRYCLPCHKTVRHLIYERHKSEASRAA
jgi:hypothetical protein